MSDMSGREFFPLQPPHLQDVEQPQFDPFDEGQMKELFGDRMGPTIGGLLQLRKSAKLAQGSYGLSSNLFTEMVLPELDKLHANAIEVFKESL